MDQALEAIKASAKGNQGLQRKITTLEKNEAFLLYQGECMKLRLSDEERVERDESVQISRKRHDAEIDRLTRESDCAARGKGLAEVGIVAARSSRP